jgi:hypothetical protein
MPPAPTQRVILGVARRGEDLDDAAAVAPAQQVDEEPGRPEVLQALAVPPIEPRSARSHPSRAGNEGQDHSRYTSCTQGSAIRCDE